MTGEIKTTLEFENYKLLPFLFGDHDRNIARIEQKLRVSIGCFGNQIEIKGSEKGVNQASAAIEALYKKLDIKGNTECIDFDIVDAAINRCIKIINEFKFKELEEKKSYIEKRLSEIISELTVKEEELKSFREANRDIISSPSPDLSGETSILSI